MAMLFLLLFLLVTGLQVAHAFVFQNLTFSQVQQCGPLSVSFGGGQPPAALPLSLTIVPFNSSLPLHIELPPSSWNEATLTGEMVTFLPYAAGTSFVASLDDATGNATMPVSDTIIIQYSSNTSCVTGAEVDAANYTLASNLSQCGAYTVAYNSSVVTRPPTVRAFQSFLPAFTATMFNNATLGTASFVLDAFGGRPVVLLFDDGEGHAQTTAMEFVQNGHHQNNSCIPADLASEIQSSGRNKTGVHLSTTAVIAIAAGASGAVLACAIAMTIFVYRDRRRKRAAKAARAGISSSDVMEKGLPPPPLTRPRSSLKISPRWSASRVIKQSRPYGEDSPPRSATLLRPNERNSPKNSVGSDSEGAQRRSLTTSAVAVKLPAPARPRRPSVQSLDIQRLLDMATASNSTRSSGSVVRSPSIQSPTVRPPSVRYIDDRAPGQILFAVQAAARQYELPVSPSLSALSLGSRIYPEDDSPQPPALARGQSFRETLSPVTPRTVDSRRRIADVPASIDGRMDSMAFSIQAI